MKAIGYSDLATPDAVTTRLRANCDEWRDVAGLSDEWLAEVVRQDRIDVLVDLAGHMPHNRLLTFARRPAPVQVSFLEYPDTTGMSAMGYRITDSYKDPFRQTEQFHTEKLVRLDPCCCRLASVSETPVRVAR